MEEIYQRIEELCREKSITVTEMCRKCQIPRATLSDFKNGRVKSLSASVLAKIAAFFEVSVDHLLGKEETRAVSENDLKVALFGGGEGVTEAMWNEVKNYARYIQQRENGAE